MQANEMASAKHRDELSQYQTQLLKQNTDLTQQIHKIAEHLAALTEDVHRATCEGGPSAGRMSAST